MYNSYFVVKGIIADISLEIMATVKNFRIKHLPEIELCVRIGNHTGPCCAGRKFQFYTHWKEAFDNLFSLAQMETLGLSFMVSKTGFRSENKKLVRPSLLQFEHL